MTLRQVQFYLRLGVTLVDTKSFDSHYYLIPRPGGQAYWTNDPNDKITDLGWDPSCSAFLKRRLRYLQVYIPDSETESP